MINDTWPIWHGALSSIFVVSMVFSLFDTTALAHVSTYAAYFVALPIYLS